MATRCHVPIPPSTALCPFLASFLPYRPLNPRGPSGLSVRGPPHSRLSYRDAPSSCQPSWKSWCSLGSATAVSAQAARAPHIASRLAASAQMAPLPPQGSSGVLTLAHSPGQVGHAGIPPGSSLPASPAYPVCPQIPSASPWDAVDALCRCPSPSPHTMVPTSLQPVSHLVPSKVS